MTEEEKQNAVEKALGEPFSTEFQENAFKVRRNLLVFAFISLVVTMGDVKVGDKVEVFGLSLENFSVALLQLSLLLVTIYHQVHFVWYCVDSFSEWRLHTTGTKLAFVTGFMWDNEDKDKSKDPRQSTLYNWWLQQTRGLGNDIPTAKDALQKLSEFEAILKTREVADDKYHLNLHSSHKLVTEARADIAKNLAKMEAIEKTITSARIPVSLERFDRFFHLAKRSANLRWLLIEMCAPMLIGFAAIASLVMKFYMKSS